MEAHNVWEETKRNVFVQSYIEEAKGKLMSTAIWYDEEDWMQAGTWEIQI